MSVAGDYEVVATYDGETLNSGQQVVHSYDPSAVRVHGLEGGAVGSLVSFHGQSIYIQLIIMNFRFGLSFGQSDIVYVSGVIKIKISIFYPEIEPQLVGSAQH